MAPMMRLASDAAFAEPAWRGDFKDGSLRGALASDVALLSDMLLMSIIITSHGCVRLFTNARICRRWRLSNTSTNRSASVASNSACGEPFNWLALCFGVVGTYIIASYDKAYLARHAHSSTSITCTFSWSAIPSLNGSLAAVRMYFGLRPSLSRLCNPFSFLYCSTSLQQ